MVFVEFSPVLTVDGKDVPPTKKAVRQEKTNFWLIPPDEKDQIPGSARVLSNLEAAMQAQPRNDLPVGHPLRGERIPKGPFAAGTLPGDIRFNLDGSFEFYKDGVWEDFTDTNGDLVLADPDVALGP